MNLSLAGQYQATLTRLGSNLIGAVFPLMKFYPAEYCVRAAVEAGLISAQTLVVETSSGSLALGLALACNMRRQPLTIVSDYSCDAPLRARLQDLNAYVEIVPAAAKSGGYQRARLDRVRQVQQENPDHWWVNQYDNPNNAASYIPFAAQLIAELGRVDCLVGTVGSGGSVCGTGRALKAGSSELTVVGVDTHHSVLFGQRDDVREFRGLGNSVLPANVDHTLFDEVHWVSAAEGYRATRELHRSTGLFRGGTSGAAWMVARHWAGKHPNKTVVCLLPDDGHRYIDTIYNDGYLLSKGLWLDELPSVPLQVVEPQEASSSWTTMDWSRRSYTDLSRIGAEMQLIPR